MSVKFWCFTSNNPDSVPFYDDENCTYLVYQLEQGDSGTPHHQGYVEFKARKSMAQAKTILRLPRAHFERRKGTSLQASDYCKKEPRLSPFQEYGFLSNMAGTRTDLHSFLSSVTDGLKLDDSFDLFPEIHAKFPRFVTKAYENKRLKELPALHPFTPREGWQLELATILADPPHARQVIWIFDSAGDTGKSFFAQHYQPYGYVITGGKHADIYYAYSFESVVFFDWARNAVDFPYSVAETFKNGYYLSTKYEVRRVRFAVPHVVVFSNNEPDRSQLSADRWRVINVRRPFGTSIQTAIGPPF